jgi:hypothetical protein
MGNLHIGNIQFDPIEAFLWNCNQQYKLCIRQIWYLLIDQMGNQHICCFFRRVIDSKDRFF